MTKWRSFAFCDEPGCDAKTSNPAIDGWSQTHGLDYCFLHSGYSQGITDEALAVLNRINAQHGKPPYVPMRERGRPADATGELW